ncbi:MAG TPA: GNAT family N-acetyltransferase [Stellaceae bacterium]|nr:GNAT family N-acetyltransferase [Stellaceae bacterium]
MNPSEVSGLVKFAPSMAEISAPAWDRCAGTDNPFLSHAFLEALEESGSATAETGWLPRHAIIEDQSGRLVGAMPLYVKSHSYGEYVFDQGWADAYRRAGGRYYPKLLAAVPFTPVSGKRLLLHGQAPPNTAETLITGVIDFARRYELSSLHVNFPTLPEWEWLAGHGFLKRMDQQFHWENQGYGSFDDFLETLTSRKRKQIRRERRDVLESGITIETLTGADLQEHHWDAFFHLYQATSDRKWGSAYLTRPFFSLLGERLGRQIVLVMARRDHAYIAGALNLMGATTLFGRNWGGVGDLPFLHFEICYYRALDFAIERGLKRVEAGAQGTHKIQRGYLPTPTYSAHWIADPRFARAVNDYLERERSAVADHMEELQETLSPFRQVPEP